MVSVQLSVKGKSILNSQVKEAPVSPAKVELYPSVDSGNKFYADLVKTQFLTSRAIAAFLLFFLVNITFRMQFQPTPFGLSERSFIWWAVKDYRELSKAPDIMLFGSSLMLAAVNEGDATRYRKLVDTAIQHRSNYLEELLKQRFGQDISTFCFAIGGQMASDVYSIATNFVTKEFKPRTIIWGIAPRDLIDSAFSGAITSDTAVYMNKIAGREIISDEHKSLVSFMDRSLCHLIFMYREKQDIVALLKERLRDLQTKEVSTKNVTPGRSKMLRELMNPRDGTMGDIAVGEWMIGANAEPSKTLKDNTREYMMRYNPFKQKTFLTQRTYFQKFLHDQQELGVKVILVNMPLTGINMALLPASTYELYIKTLKDSAAMYGAQIIDLNSDSRFKQSDFFDTAHLNGLGSEKLIKLLSTYSKSDWSNSLQQPKQIKFQ